MAFDSFMYRDPAEVAERRELDAMGCEACGSSMFTLVRVGCADPRNARQKGVPSVGHRCKWFVLREGKQG